MPWSTSTRAARLPPNWPKIRASILERDNHHCRLQYAGCIRHATEVDHAVAGDNHHESNLQAACTPCHRTKSQREAQAAKPSRRRTPEPHPGIT